MILRKAQAADVDAIEQIEQRSFGRAEERFHRRQIASLVRNPRGIVLIAENAGKPLGWGAALVRRHRRSGAARPHVSSGRIYSVAVDPDGRGMGIGRELMEEMLRQLRQRGARRVYLEVRTDNAAAIRLYEKLGFATIAQLDHYYAQHVHALRMLREE